MYRCPFCKQEIEDGIDSFIEHRKRGGDCETHQEERLTSAQRPGRLSPQAQQPTKEQTMATTARTTVTHPDATVDKRGSKSRAYTHAVVRGPLVPEARINFLMNDSAEAQAEIDTIKAALVEPKFTKAFRGYNRDEDTVNSYDWALKGPRTAYTRNGGGSYPTIQERGTSEGLSQCNTQYLSANDVIKGDNAEAVARGSFANFNAEEHEYVLVDTRSHLVGKAYAKIAGLEERIVRNTLEAFEISDGERNLGGYGVMRWSSSRDLAAKAADGEFSFLSDQGYQVYVQEVDKAV